MSEKDSNQSEQQEEQDEQAEREYRCGHCESKISSGIKYCSSCGEKLDTSVF